MPIDVRATRRAEAAASDLARSVDRLVGPLRLPNKDVRCRVSSSDEGPVHAVHSCDSRWIFMLGDAGVVGPALAVAPRIRPTKRIVLSYSARCDSR